MTAKPVMGEPLAVGVADELVYVSFGNDRRRLALWHRRPATGSAGRQARSVLSICGATFPTMLAIGHRFDGFSWMDDLAAAGFDVWGLDFLGYGASDRYPAMANPAAAGPPLGRVPAASRQIAEAVAFIRDQQGIKRLSLIAHSWGTMAAAHCATVAPALVDRLVLFGPITRRQGTAPAASWPAYRDISLDAQWQRFVADVPQGESPVLLERHFAEWGPAYLATDPGSETRMPPRVRVPAGPAADIAAAWTGDFPYDPGQIEAPTLIVRGEWDSLVTDEDARWLFAAMTAAPLKEDVKIGRATHLMHLEQGRHQLYRAVRSFLAGGDRSIGERSEST